MPSFDELVFGLNRVMNDQATRRRCHNEELFAESRPLTVDVFDHLGLLQRPGLRGLLATHLSLFPSGLSSSLRHILRFVCEKENEDVPLLLVWLGGYYRLDVQHSHATPETRGMVTVILHTPPPSSRAS